MESEGHGVGVTGRVHGGGGSSEGTDRADPLPEKTVIGKRMDRRVVRPWGWTPGVRVLRNRKE